VAAIKKVIKSTEWCRYVVNQNITTYSTCNTSTQVLTLFPGQKEEFGITSRDRCCIPICDKATVKMGWKE
jgi:hypothetical protein